MPQLSCIGRDGKTRIFEYKIEENSLAGEWRLRVTTIPPLPSGDFFELCVAEISAGTVRVVMAHHFNKAEYVAMGIPEALLPAVKVALGKTVESSPSTGAVGGVFRTEAATKYWQRLYQQGGATYDPDTGIYKVA